MMNEVKPQKSYQGYFYDQQVKRFLGTFMAIFSGMQVQTGKREDGERRMQSVPVVYGSKDRVVAAVMAENTQNKPIRLPAMSVYLDDINISPQRMKGTGTIRNTPVVPAGGLLPNDAVNLKQRVPVPYDMSVQLAIYTSNLDQHLQILEQIMMIFDPSVQIERSDAMYDFAKVVVVTLERIRLDENYPAGTDRRRMQSTLTFSMPVWIETPAEVRDDLVKSIHLRVQAINDLSAFVDSVAISEPGDYETIADVDNLNMQ